jgi:hypothetical protein
MLPIMVMGHLVIANGSRLLALMTHISNTSLRIKKASRVSQAAFLYIRMKMVIN